MRGKLLASLLVSFLCSGGCGTVANLAVGTRSTLVGLHTRPYGGVYADFAILDASLTLLPLSIVDCPLSLVGDTLTLPYTIIAGTGLEPDLEERDEDEPPGPRVSRE